MVRAWKKWMPFGCRGEIAADGTELLGAGERAQASGHLLPQLDHPYLAFGGVVVEGHPRIDGEPQVVVLTVEQAPGQGVVLAHHLVLVGAGGLDAEQRRAAVAMDRVGESGRVDVVEGVAD